MLRYRDPFFSGSSIRKFAADFVDDNGSLRTDISSCTFRLIKRDDTSVVLMSGSCTVTSASGLAEFTPSWAHADFAAMVYGEPMAAIAQFTPTFTGGATGATMEIDAEIRKPA